MYRISISKDGAARIIMDLITVYLLLIIVSLIGGYASYKYAEKRYERGLLDAIQMHNEGRLTYTSYMEGDVEMISIDIKPDE